MHTSPLRPAALALVLGLALASPCRSAAPVPDDRDARPTSSPPSPHPSRTALLIGAAAGGILLSTQLDGWAADEMPEQTSARSRQVARTAEKGGNPLYVGAGLALAAGIGPLIGHREWTGSALRIGGGVIAAAGASGLLKEVVGRSRPYETPGDQDDVMPFSGHSSFPSGHTTVAFAVAAGLDAECESRWVSMAAYPAAALVGWSRMRDNRHWASDVVAGALLGTLVGRTVVHFEQKMGDAEVKSMKVDLDQVGPDGARSPAVGLKIRF